MVRLRMLVVIHDMRRQGLTISAIAAKLQEPIVSCGTATSQYGAIAAIAGRQDCVFQMRDVYRKRRDLAVEFLKARNACSCIPRGAFYLMVDISASGLDGEAFAIELLESRRIGVAPGQTFGPGSRDYVRISMASSEEDILCGLGAICEMLETRERQIGQTGYPAFR